MGCHRYINGLVESVFQKTNQIYRALFQRRRQLLIEPQATQKISHSGTPPACTSEIPNINDRDTTEVIWEDDLNNGTPKWEARGELESYIIEEVVLKVLLRKNILIKNKYTTNEIRRKLYDSLSDHESEDYELHLQLLERSSTQHLRILHSPAKDHHRNLAPKSTKTKITYYTLVKPHFVAHRTPCRITSHSHSQAPPRTQPHNLVFMHQNTSEVFPGER
jgi:hypothetical protein